MSQKGDLFPNVPERLRGMKELAGNLWWGWHPEARMVFKMLSRQAWKESGHNSVRMLREIPKEILESAVRDPGYVSYYDEVLARFREYMAASDSWISTRVPDSSSYRVAYFSTEYGLHHSLPFYAGGLGFLAGDYMKECSDLGIPLVAVGFMYPEGYVRQRIREDGWQENLDEILDRDAASVSRVVQKSGERLLVRVPLTEPPIHVAVWRIAVGRACLYLMDTDVEANDPASRQVSAHLYAGDLEQRLRQEIVLGIGGSAVLDALGIEYSVLHLNEGHAAFALLERIRKRVEGGVSYKDAVEQVERSSVFTTHTPVAAGHDVFPFELMEKYFRPYWTALGLNREEFLELGASPAAPQAGFCMTAAALRMSGFRNAVSKRHGEVARRMWRSVWPDVPEEKVPIDHVTNGVHVPTWVDPRMKLLFDRYLGPDWQEDHDNRAVWELVDSIPDEELWRTHYWLKIKLIDAIRERSRQRWAHEHASCPLALVGGALLDPSVLTIGFARRFVTYKRADLIFRDVERLRRLLNDRWRPIQIIFAGKAHPADDPAKQILQKIVNQARDPRLGGRIAFIEDYGEQFAQYMVHGVDVWLNNPIPPLEASGTSGMKAALNGVLNLSIMDGWWLEGFNGRNGWAFGGDAAGARRDDAPARREEDRARPDDTRERRDDTGARADDTLSRRDEEDARALYEVLESQVIPLYYKASKEGVPTEWVRMMKESIKSIAPTFSARRMAKEYADKFYSRIVQRGT